jgi:SAM-dependent methyltransferase
MDTTFDSTELRPAAALPAWLDEVLPASPARILDAGCGTGVLARMLTDRGYDVTAIDVDPAAVEAANEHGVPALSANLIDYDDEPFDVVLLALSLHHMHPLQAAVERASALVARGGLLVLDEFARDWADDAAAAWFYDAADLLAAAHLLDLESQSTRIDPLTRWQVNHADHTPGEAMVEAVAARLTLTDLRRTPYLARYLGGKLEGTAPGQRVHAELERIELDRINRRMLPPVGFRLVARHHRRD